MMRRSTLFSLLLITLFLTLMVAAFPIQQKPSFNMTPFDYKKAWSRVDSLDGQGLPQSAWEVVDSIYAIAKAEGAEDHLIRALLYQSKYRTFLEEEATNQIFGEMRSNLPGLSASGRAILHSILGELYFRYYQNNRYIFYERTATTQVEEDDVATWDLKKILTEAIGHYLLSVEPADSLKAYPVETYQELLMTVPDTRSLRPTLYDFLAHRAVDFLSNEEASLITPEKALILQEERWFLPAAAFVAEDLPETSQPLPGYEALRLLQNLLAFHQKREDVAAHVDADLLRLNLVHRYSVVPTKDSLYVQRLEDLRTRHHDEPAFAEVTYALAQEYERRGGRYHPRQADGSLLEKDRLARRQAHTLCLEAIERFPQTTGASQCRSLQASIEQKFLSFQMEEANEPNASLLTQVTYRNVNTLYVKVLRTTYEERKAFERANYQERPAILQAFTQKEGIEAFTVTLPNDGDFQQHVTEFALSALDTGMYMLMASTSPAFTSEGEALGYTFFQVTHLSYIARRHADGSYDLFALRRSNGEPLSNVQVQLQYTDSQTERAFQTVAQTDRQGYAHIQARDRASFLLHLVHGQDHYYPQESFYSFNYSPKIPYRQTTHFFTDRAIYRPGQTIYFKGIRVGMKGKASEILPGVRSQVALMDVNYQEVASVDVVSNEYGTFSGSFTVPHGVLMGNMWIQDDFGMVDFSVEEYKRPRFEVVFNPFEGTPLAGDEVTVQGVATSYAGASLSGAQVAYRVVRTPRWHHWYFRGWPPPVEEVEIGRGAVETALDGSFSITFAALPDLSLSRKLHPQFVFRITADVTDITGETHSAQQQVVVGYTALNLQLELPESLDRTQPQQVQLGSTNLNGAFVPVRGRLEVVRLKSPGRIFRRRLWESPDRFTMDRETFYRLFPHDVYDQDDDPATWQTLDTVLSQAFDTGEEKSYDLAGLSRWPLGSYRVTLHAEDPTGQPLQATRYVTVFSSEGKSVAGTTPDWFVSLKNTVEPGDKAVFLIGSAASNAHIRFEIEHEGKIVESRWMELSKAQTRIELPILEKHRGNVTVRATMVHFNRVYQHTQTLSVPYTNRQLHLSLSTFRDKMYPGSEETWKLQIKGPGGEAVAAEMVATMYDASLDTFRPHGWSFNILEYDYPQLHWQDIGLQRLAQATVESKGWYVGYGFQDKHYDTLNWFGFTFFGAPRYYMKGEAPMALREERLEAAVAGEEEFMAMDTSTLGAKAEGKEIAPAQPPAPRLEQVQARRNLNETAFFFPHLETTPEGDVVLTFTMPEALTRWRMFALAHTKDLKFGQLLQEVVTQKELMVTPNAPRFFREGDTLRFAAKVSNMSDTLLTGQIQLMLFDALTMAPLDEALHNRQPVQSFTVEKDGSQAFHWTLQVPEGLSAVTYRVVARAGNFSDGEEAVVPVLTNRMLVTESLPLPVRGNQTKTFRFNKLLSTTSPTLRHHRFTLEYTPHPIWYAVQALPYLMEFPYECAEQVFSRYYANSISTHIVRQNPKIERVYEAWRREGASALLSNLEKNQELKTLMLEATPWVLQAQDETERKRRLAVLFDTNRMRDEQARALRKLFQLQQDGGAWPWFEGMHPDRYITQHIVSGMGHLKHLGVLNPQTEDQIAQAIAKAIVYLDRQIQEDYDRLLARKEDLKQNHIGVMQVHYLYTRSFFPEVPLDPQYQTAYDYYFQQAQTYWTAQDRYFQGMAALALHRRGDTTTPDKIVRSLREFSLMDEEMGMYWKLPYGYFWYQAPIETQALLTEVFHEVAQDEEAVEAMKQWLLKQKQTQDWRTTKATADAIYALLLQGTDLTMETSRVEIELGDHRIDTQALPEAEAGTGYFKTAWDAHEITPAMGEITVKKEGKGIAWGAAYWQYFEQLDRITPHETPLRLEKGLFLEKKTETGPVLVPIDSTDALVPGDLLKVRLILRTDRDMEYVHMKDMRASGLEPIQVLSGYRYQGGLGYYESTRDAATHFFFGYLPKGTYVFEYPLRVNHAGSFSNGITTIESMYAPEFSAHSEGIRLTVSDKR